MKRLRLACALVCALVLLGASVAPAQVQTGSISGVVLDPQGNSVPDAKVTVRDKEQGTVYTVKTDTGGTFVVSGLAFGLYTVTIEAQGFRKYEALNVRVVTAQDASVRAKMEVGELSETVTVEAGQELLNTTTAELTTNISRTQILNLPLLTRNPLDLVRLQPGVTGTGGTRTAVFNGLRGATNNITQDGINIQDNFIRNDGFFAMSAPTVENTGEFSISSSNIGSDSGAGVGQVRIATPRGSNSFSGSLFYFHRNDALNANTFFNNITDPGTPKERLRQHRFGGSVGGPVYIPKVWDGRDKSFFFFRYEGFRENFAVTRNRNVLTDSARQGLFTYTGTDGVDRTINLLTASTRGFGLNPLTTALIGATPLPNNTLIGDVFNIAGHRFNINGSDPDDRYTIRVDQKLIESQRYGTHWVEWVYNWGNFIITPDTFNAVEAAFPEGIATSCVGGVCEGNIQSSNRKVMAAAIHSTISSTMFNEFRVGFQRAPVLFPRVNPFPRSFRLDFLAITDPEQNALSQGRITPLYSFIDNMSKVWRNHNFKWGFNVTSVSVKDFNDAGILPLIQLNSNTQNQDGLADALFPASNTTIRTRARNIYAGLVGLLGNVNQTFNADPDLGYLPNNTNSGYFRERSYSFYFEDSWRVRPNLTLNLGVRYELVPAADAVNRRALQPSNGMADIFFGGSQLFTPDPSITYNMLRTGAVPDTGLVLAGASNGRPFWATDKNNFAPFVGIAYSLNNKTVIRTGFAVSYTRDGLTVVSQPVNSNDGLTLGSALSFPLGVLDPSNPPIVPAPTFSLPVSQITNFLRTGAGSGIFIFDPQLKTPYVMQWSFGIEREITPSLAISANYVANRAVKLRRGLDFGQIDIRGNGLLDEFMRSQSNLNICAANRLACTGSATGALRFDNRGLPGQVDLPILQSINFPASFFSSTTFTNLLAADQNAVGEWAHQIHINSTFNYFASNGASFPGLGALPSNFFRSNGATILADSITNEGTSDYQSLQFEVRKRTSRGVSFQANYTFGKVLTNSSGAGQNTFDPNIDILQPDYDRTRADFDIRHTINFNGIWEVPVGKGRRYLSNGILGKVFEGWQMGGITRWRSGRAISILSGRGTINRNARSANRNGATLLDRTAQDVCGDTGVYRTDNGVFWLPEEYFVRSTGTNTQRGSTSIFGNPAPGTLGTQSFFNGCSGPRFFQVDMNFVKRTYITERVNFEFRAEFFNLFNNTNFNLGQNHNINNTGFGTIGATFDSREIQFNFRINW